MGNNTQQSEVTACPPSPERLGSEKICGERWHNHANCESPHVCGLPHGHVGNHKCGFTDIDVCGIEWPNTGDKARRRNYERRNDHY
jgi:hypothetical protein